MEITIGLIGLLIAILTFWFAFYRKPKEELDLLKVQFKATQKLSKKLQNELESFIVQTNSKDLLMFENISFGSYLFEMKKSYEENLSDELYNKFDRLNLTKPIINSMIKSLETQFEALKQIQIHLRMYQEQVTNS